MLLTNSKIDRHKVDIERRISELEKKLHQPLRAHPENPLPAGHHHPSGNIPELSRPIQAPFDPRLTHIYSSPQYQESKEVQRIRQRTVLKDRNAADVNEYGKMRGSRLVPGSNLENWGQQKGVASFHEGATIQGALKQDSELKNMMNLIIQNQKSLQEEISLMRVDWLRQQRERADQVPFLPKHQSDDNIPNKVGNESFQKSAYNMQNLPPSKIVSSQGLEGTTKDMEEVSFDGKGNLDVGRRSKGDESQKARLEAQKRQRPLSHKKPKSSETVDLHSLVKRQKSKSERLVVGEQGKSEFWKKVQGRVRDSQKQYRDAFHRNNRQEHEHLVGASELQRKLRADLLEKIYGQCNRCLYK